MWLTEVAMAPTNDQLTEHRDRIYTLLYLYMFVVFASALSLIILLWGKAMGHFASMPWTALSGWAVASGGLGAGSLIFKKPLDTLFASSDSPVGEPRD
jgi:hypothetical protein